MIAVWTHKIDVLMPALDCGEAALLAAISPPIDWSLMGSELDDMAARLTAHFRAEEDGFLREVISRANPDGSLFNLVQIAHEDLYADVHLLQEEAHGILLARCLGRA